VDLAVTETHLQVKAAAEAAVVVTALALPLVPAVIRCRMQLAW